MKLTSIIILAISLLASSCSEQRKRGSTSVTKREFPVIHQNSELGYRFELTNLWDLESKSDEGFSVEGFSPDGKVRLIFQSRYIHSCPQGVSSHKEWMELQFIKQQDVFEVEYIRAKDVPKGSCMEVYYHGKGDGENGEYIYSYVLNFMDFIENSDHRRCWVFSILTTDKDFIGSPRFKKIIKSLSVSNFTWT